MRVQALSEPNLSDTHEDCLDHLAGGDTEILDTLDEHLEEFLSDLNIPSSFTVKHGLEDKSKVSKVSDRGDIDGFSLCLVHHFPRAQVPSRILTSLPRSVRRDRNPVYGYRKIEHCNRSQSSVDLPTSSSTLGMSDPCDKSAMKGILMCHLSSILESSGRKT